MARTIGIEGIALGILAMLLSAAQASAQAVRGAIGPKSQADVHVSVRVMPRFKLQSQSVPADSVKPGVRSLSFSTNAPNLRYAIMTRPVATGRTADDRLLVLVVPD